MTVLQDYYLMHAVLSTGYFFAGRWMALRIRVGSEGRRVHGVFVFWWTWLGFTLGGIIAPLAGWGSGPMGWNGMAGFSLLAGWVIGMLHGGLVLAVRRFRGLTPSGHRRLSD